MEDRLTTRLWLEPGDEPDGGIRLNDLEGVSHIHRFENQVPDRTDLPRTLDEFLHLTILEVDDRFVPPADSRRGMLFEPTARPGQGVLTGRPTSGISLVLISPQEREQAQALRDWADFIHIRHIAEAAVPGMTMITPYRNVTGHDPAFMHLYEIDADDPEAVFQSMTPMVTDRIGPRDSDAWKRWAMCPELRICYVNTFRKPAETPRQ